MRINKKLLKQRRHANQLKIPRNVKQQFDKEFKAGNVPSDPQIKLAVKLGLVKQNDNGVLDPKSLANYFKTFIQQRNADDER